MLALSQPITVMVPPCKENIMYAVVTFKSVKETSPCYTIELDLGPLTIICLTHQKNKQTSSEVT